MIEKYAQEVQEYIEDLDVSHEGEHIYDNYQKVVAISLRLQEIHNLLALRELEGKATAEEKKFRTLIIDSTIERLDRLAQFESRKMTGKAMEWEMTKKG